MLPHDGQHSYPFIYRSGPAEKQAIVEIQTHTAVANNENTYLGTVANGGIRVWKAMPIEYIVGALFPVMLKLSNTIRNFPNLPAGESIALSSPPTLPSVNPAFQLSTEGADIAAAAPRHWIVIFRLSEEYVRPVKQLSR